MDYKDKYLKYKNKYLELKKMRGGLAPAQPGSAPFTIVNNNYCVFDAPGETGKIVLHHNTRSTADIAHDQPNRALSAYFEHLPNIYGNSINVEAYLFPFNYPDNIVRTVAHTINNIPIHLSRITISSSSIDVVTKLLQELPVGLPGGLPVGLPANKFLLGVAYTNASKLAGRWKSNPPGLNNGQFLDVQLCITGGSKNIDTTGIQTAAREIQEECGLNVLDGLKYIGQIGRHHSYLLNATATTLTTNTVYAKPTGIDDKDYKTAVMIYGDLPYLQSLITSQLTRTDINDVQGIVLVRLT